MKKIIILLSRCILFAFIFSLISLVIKKSLIDLTNLWSIVACIVNFIVIAMIIYYGKKHNKKYTDIINYKKGKSKILNTIAIVVMMLVVGILGMYISGLICYQKFPYMDPMMIAPIPLWIAIINLVILPVTTTLAEDGLYLGIGINDENIGMKQVIVVAIIYALQHSFIPFIPDVRFMIYRFLSFLPLTIIICILYYKKRNLVPIMAGHALLNLATAINILIMSAAPTIYLQLIG